LTGTHTNGIEVAWHHAKRYVKKSCKSSNAVKLQQALYCYMWFCWIGKPHPGGPFQRFLQDIREQFICF